MKRMSAATQATLQIVWACDRRYLLTGTPVVNKPLDLVALINMLGKLNSVFGGWKAFVDRYCDAHQTEWCYDTSGASNLNELHEKLNAEKIMLRRMKHEVLQLPKKTRTIKRIAVDPADLTHYQKCEQALAAEIKKNPKIPHSNVFPKFDTRLAYARSTRQLRALKKSLPKIKSLSSSHIIALFVRRSPPLRLVHPRTYSIPRLKTGMRSHCSSHRTSTGCSLRRRALVVLGSR
jgi:SNF2 family DNA or RNA helicase